MSAGWRGGSSREWRRLRRLVLDRDGHHCQKPVEFGEVCGQPATTVGHIDALADGGVKLADPSRLRAECASHNYGDGARRTNAQRQASVPARGWSW